MKGTARIRVAVVFLLFCGLFFEYALAACPHSCSGHGSCGSENVCTCDWGWDVAPDCSLRKCPNATSWGVKPYATSQGHATTECSGVGVCDFATGLCRCPVGFTGQACERLSCPKDCNGQGTCQTIRNVGFTYGRDLTAAYASGGDGKGPIYANWDHSSTTMCVCDVGFTGPDCSQRICPKGDDPMTTGQAYREIVIESGASSGLLGGFFDFSFLGESVRFSANASNWTATDCDRDIESLANVQSVTCTRTGANSARLSANYTVKFLSWPSMPYENNVYSHSGNPSLLDFSCDISEAGGTAVNPYCKIYDVTATNIKEYKECSGRGICDPSTAQCTCAAGFDGIDCQMSTASVSSTTSGVSDVMLLYSTSGGFTGNNLRLKTDRIASSDFNYIYAESNSLATYQLKGNGDMVMHQGGLTVTSGGETITSGGLVIGATGQTITSGGLIIQGGGATIKNGLVVKSGGQTISKTGLNVLDGGATITTTSKTEPALELFANADKRLSQSSILRVRADRNATNDPQPADNFALIEAIIGKHNNPANQTVFRVSGQPRTEIHVGGLEVKAGGQTITAGGLSITAGGLTIASGSLVLSGGAIDAQGFTSSSVTSFTAPVDAQGQTLTLTGATLEGAFTTAAGFTSAGLTSFTAAVDANAQTLTVTGATLEGAFTAAAGFTSGGATSFTAAVSVINQVLTTTGATAKGALTFADGFTSSGTTSFTGGVTNSGTTSFTGAVSLASQTVTVGAATIEGAATFNDGFTSAGVTSFTSEVSVINQVLTTTGATAKGALTFANGFTSAGVTSFTAAVDAASQTVTLTGSTLEGAFTIDAMTTFTNGLSSDALLTATGMTVSGTVTASGAALTSDRRYKKNVSALSSPLESIMKLKGVSYDWKVEEYPEHHFDNFTHYGFIAQEVEEVIPDIVGTDENGWKSIRYLGFTPVIVEAFKEQQATIVSLQEDIKNLEMANQELLEEFEKLRVKVDKLYKINNL